MHLPSPLHFSSITALGHAQARSCGRLSVSLPAFPSFPFTPFPFHPSPSCPMLDPPSSLLLTPPSVASSTWFDLSAVFSPLLPAVRSVRLLSLLGLTLTLALCSVPWDGLLHNSPAAHTPSLTQLPSHSSSPSGQSSTVSAWRLCPLAHTLQVMAEYELAYHPQPSFASDSAQAPSAGFESEDAEELSRARFRVPPSMDRLKTNSIRPSFPSAWLSEASSDLPTFKLSVYELRFDAGSGQWWLLTVVDRVYGREGGAEKQGEVMEQDYTGWGFYSSLVHGVSSTLRRWEELGHRFHCQDDWSGARVVADMELSDHWMALSCPFPLFPHSPPTSSASSSSSSSSSPQPALSLHLLHPLMRGGRIEVLLQHKEQGTLELLSDPAFELSPSAAALPSTAPLVSVELGVCHRREVVVSVSHCSPVLWSSVYLHQLLAFIAHHAYSGMERFHVYDRHGVYYPLLLPYIASGLVEYEVAPLRGIGATTESQRYNDQVLYLEKCRWHNSGTAGWSSNLDIDEWLAFPNTSFIRERPASCFTLHSPPLDTSNPYADQHTTLVHLDRTRPTHALEHYYSQQALTLRQQVQARQAAAQLCSCSSMLLTYLTTVSDRSLYHYSADLQVPVQLDPADPRPLMVPPSRLQDVDQSGAEAEVEARRPFRVGEFEGAYSWWVAIRFLLMATGEGDPASRDNQPPPPMPEHTRWLTLLEQATQGNSTAIELTGMREAARWRSSSSLPLPTSVPPSSSSPLDPHSGLMTERWFASTSIGHKFLESWKWFIRPHTSLPLMRHWATPYIRHRQPGTLWDHYEAEQQSALTMHLFDWQMPLHNTRPRPLSEVAFHHFVAFVRNRSIVRPDEQMQEKRQWKWTEQAASITRRIHTWTQQRRGEQGAADEAE